MEKPHMVVRAAGRPRSDEAHRAILVATLELLAEEGFSRLTIRAVAGRAGVGSATIYRRWPSKAPLVLEALGTMILPTTIPDTGSLRGDLVSFLRERIATSSSSRLTRVLPALAAEGARDPELAASWSQVQAPARQAMFAVFERGIRRGELPPDLDFEFLLDLLLGPITYRLLITGIRLEPGLAEQIVDTVLLGVSHDRR